MPVCSHFRGSRRWLISKDWIWAVILFALAMSDSLAQTTSYSIQVQPGYNSIANHLNRGQNTLGEVIPDPPDGSVLWKFNPATQRYYDTQAQFIPGFGWLYQEPEMGYLKPGEGAFLQVNVNAILTFSGTIAPFPLPRYAVAGYNFVSGQEPRSMSFPEVFGFAPQPGDVVYLFEQPFSGDPQGFQQSASSIHKFTAAQGWDVVPTFRRGRSAFVYLAEGAPRITKNPISQIVNAGQTVRLDLSVIGAAPLSYQWLMNDDELPGETNPFLVISNAQFWNSGAYSVVVSNQLGTATSRAAFVRVNSRPVILDQPQPVLTAPSNTVFLQVRATGTPFLRYQWFRDNTPISGATQPILQIDNAQQSGQYFVRVSNNLGFAQSQAVPLTVVIPPQIISQPVSLTAGLGQTVSFRVVAEGTQPLTYHWRHNGQRIPWGTNATLVVSNILPRDAGSYDVAVANAIGAVHSNPVLLFLDVPTIFLSDKITGAEIYSMPAFTARSDNLRATDDDGEIHCARPGGSSVWLRWMTREPGIVRFETSGSSFDTVIAAYIINAAGQQLVACDDDEGAFFGSRIQFAAIPNMVYYIAIDGLDGARGHIILDWELEPTPDTLPLITLQPQDQTANFGDRVLFTVKVDPPPGVALRFQWYHDGVRIEGANGSELPVPFQPVPPRGVDSDDVGYYYVEIVANDKRLVRSRRALLEISLADTSNRLLYAFAVDKFADALDRSQRQGSGGIQSVDAVAFAPVLGYTGTQIFSTVAFSGEPGELSHCGIPGGSSAWFSFIPEASGRLYLDTAGSSFNTVLAVYTGPGPTIATLKSLVCDDDSGPGTTSSLNFQANTGTTYYIAVDGKNGVTGTAHLNYRLLVPMSLTDIVKTNDTICGFQVTATPSYPFTIQRCAGFSSWTTMLTTNSPTGTYSYYDTNAAVQKRFYRALQTP